MTRRQEYLARDMTDDEIEQCKKEANEMERTSPWTQADTDRHASYTGYTCWLDLILDSHKQEHDWWRVQYCAQMEE